MPSDPNKGAHPMTTQTFLVWLGRNWETKNEGSIDLDE